MAKLIVTATVVVDFKDEEFEKLSQEKKQLGVEGVVKDTTALLRKEFYSPNEVDQTDIYVDVALVETDPEGNNHTIRRMERDNNS